MSNLSKQEREQLIARGEGWKILDDRRLLFPLLDQDDLDRLSSRLGLYPEDYKRQMKEKAVLIGRRLGLRLPVWAAEFNQATSANFSEQTGESDQSDELPDPVDGAILYADARNKGLPAAARYTPSGHEDARRQAEEFAERRNRHFRKQRGGRE